MAILMPSTWRETFIVEPVTTVGRLASRRFRDIGAYEALRALQQWNNYFPGNPLIESYIARLMVAEGYQEKHESFVIPKSIVKRTLEAWQSFDQSQNPVPTKNSIATKAS